MLHYLLAGTLLGLSAGFAPGPLLTLVISETLKHDIQAGIRVALAPIITDLPIILLTLFVLSKLIHFHAVLGVISIIGALFVLYMGYESLKTQGVQTDINTSPPQSLLKGILVNILSPHPYLFWLSVGGPITLKAMNTGISVSFAFIISFYFFIVGSKMLLAILVGRYKSFLQGHWYLYTVRFLGFALCVLAVFLFYDGLKLLGILGAKP